MIKIELLFDPATQQLKLNIPLGVTPAMAITLLSQGITALGSQMLGNGQNLIVPAQNLPTKLH